MNSYEKLVDLVIAVVIMFIFPVLYFEKKSVVIQYHTIYNWMGEWVDEVCTQGKITKTSLDEFHQLINSFNEPIELNVSYETICYEPIYQKEAGQEYPIFTGSIHTYKKDYSMHEIVKKLEEESIFALCYGGFITVSVTFIQDNQTIYEGGKVRADVSLRNSICGDYLSCYSNTGYFME